MKKVLALGLTVFFALASVYAGTGAKRGVDYVLLSASWTKEQKIEFIQTYLDRLQEIPGVSYDTNLTDEELEYLAARDGHVHIASAGLVVVSEPVNIFNNNNFDFFNTKKVERLEKYPFHSLLAYEGAKAENLYKFALGYPEFYNVLPQIVKQAEAISLDSRTFEEDDKMFIRAVENNGDTPSTAERRLENKMNAGGFGKQDI